MGWRGSIFDGLDFDDDFQARIEALANLGRVAQAGHGAYTRPVNVKRR